MLEIGLLDTLFREARTHNAWKDEPVSDDTLREIYDILKMGPTSANILERRDFGGGRSPLRADRAWPALPPDRCGQRTRNRIPGSGA